MPMSGMLIAIGYCLYRNKVYIPICARNDKENRKK